MADIVLAEDRRRLDEVGFLVLPHFFDDDLVRIRDAVQAVFEREGERAGAEFKLEPGCRRLANLIDKDPLFGEVIRRPRLLAYVRAVLGPRIKLSSCNVRSVNPHWDQPQPLHADMGALPDERGYWVCNTVWMLDDFTPDNGPLRAVPGSHRWGKLPQEVLADARAPHPDEVVIHGQAGTVVIMNAHLWHGGLPNRTARPRTAFHAFYCRRDKPQQQYQKQLLRPETQARLPADLRELLALDDPLNDALCTQDRVVSGFLK
jgi:ectoine hydroxylase-related dioxygenase (phytanoyl-CoA dioxygenase family)